MDVHHVYRYAVVSQSRDYGQTPELGALYIRSKTPWPEVEVFIEECIVRSVLGSYFRIPLQYYKKRSCTHLRDW